MKLDFVANVDALPFGKNSVGAADVEAHQVSRKS
jgi:hypothetical protein